MSQSKKSRVKPDARVKRVKRDPNQISPLGATLIKGLSDFADALEKGEDITKRFTVRTVKLDLRSRPYGAKDVRRVRAKFNASQQLFADFLGVSVKTVRSWEQGIRPVPKIACRYMDDIQSCPEIWKKRLRITVEG
jgi:putative transcriptional regulator